MAAYGQTRANPHARRVFGENCRGARGHQARQCPEGRRGGVRGLARHVSPGQILKVVEALPADVRAPWPAEVRSDAGRHENPEPVGDRPGTSYQVVEAKINKRMFIKNRSASLLRRGTIVSITCSFYSWFCSEQRRFERKVSQARDTFTAMTIGV